MVLSENVSSGDGLVGNKLFVISKLSNLSGKSVKIERIEKKKWRNTF